MKKLCNYFIINILCVLFFGLILSSSCSTKKFFTNGTKKKETSQINISSTQRYKIVTVDSLQVDSALFDPSGVVNALSIKFR